MKLLVLCVNYLNSINEYPVLKILQAISNLHDSAEILNRRNCIMIYNEYLVKRNI